MRIEQGYRAVEILLAQIGGAQIPDEEILPAKLLIRQTCGCASAVVAQAGSSRGIPPSASGHPANSWRDRLAGCRVETVAGCA
jgi:hypothetical protein